MESAETNRDLERVLERAKRDPTAWTEAYWLLSEATVFVAHIAEAGEELDESGSPELLHIPVLESDGDSCMTVFTSRERLIEYYGPEVPRHQIHGGVVRALGHQALCVNPGHSSGVILPADLVAAIGDGSVFAPVPLSKELAPSGAVRFGVPPGPQTYITEPLAALFKERPDVIRAYLAWWYEGCGDDPPHALVGIDTSGEFAPLVDAMHEALGRVVPYHIVLRYLELTESEFSKNVREAVPPFFDRG